MYNNPCNVYLQTKDKENNIREKRGHLGRGCHERT